jgi:hypothetical protein
MSRRFAIIIILFIISLTTVSVVFFGVGCSFINSIYPTKNFTLKIYNKKLKQINNFHENIVLEYVDKSVTVDGIISPQKGKLEIDIPKFFENSIAIGHKTKRNIFIINENLYVKDPYDNNYSIIKDGPENQTIIDQIRTISPQNLYTWIQEEKNNITIERINQGKQKIIRILANKIPEKIIDKLKNYNGKFAVDISESDYLPISFFVEPEDKLSDIRKIKVSFDNYNNNNFIDFPNIDSSDINAFGDFLSRESVYLRTDPEGSYDHLWPLWEQKYFGCQQCVNRIWDGDGDGLTNIEEFLFGSDPFKKDTNSNNIDDYKELSDGKNPVNSMPLDAPYISAFNSIVKNDELLLNHKKGNLKIRSAIVQYGISVPKWAKSLTFSYGFEDEELSSYVTIFFDDKLLYKITAIPGDKIDYKDVNNGYSKEAIVPISKFSGKKGILTLILNSVGPASPSANFIIKNNLQPSERDASDSSAGPNGNKTLNQVKAQNEINFSKAQINRVNQIFEDLRDIGSKIQRKYGYDGMREARTMMSNKPVVLLQKGKVVVDFDRILLTESKNTDTDNSAFAHLSLISIKGDDNIEFNYKFIKGGDGDQLGVWIDDEQRFIMTGTLTDAELESTNIDITDLKEGDHIISFALHKYGEINAEVEVSGIKINSIKKSVLLEIQNEYKNLKSLNDFQIEKNPDYSVLKIINELPPTEENSSLWGIEDILKKADVAYNDSEYEKAYAYAFYARLIAEKIVSGWKQY